MTNTSTQRDQIAKLIQTATKAAVDDLIVITESQPRERLPKEEQIRCSMYAALKPLCKLIQVEAGYFDADKPGGKSECDFRLWLNDGSHCWVEIKRAWEGKGYVNKVPTLLEDWKADVQKLAAADPADHRVFVLFTFSDKDPCSQDTPLCRAVKEFHPGHRIVGESRTFRWRSRFNHMGIWIWLLPQAASTTAGGKQ
jgi:hypothetical protein